jgi:hypothetical protein
VFFCGELAYVAAALNAKATNISLVFHLAFACACIRPAWQAAAQPNLDEEGSSAPPNASLQRW